MQTGKGEVCSQRYGPTKKSIRPGGRGDRIQSVTKNNHKPQHSDDYGQERTKTTIQRHNSHFGFSASMSSRVIRTRFSFSFGDGKGMPRLSTTGDGGRPNNGERLALSLSRSRLNALSLSLSRSPRLIALSLSGEMRMCGRGASILLLRACLSVFSLSLSLLLSVRSLSLSLSLDAVVGVRGVCSPVFCLVIAIICASELRSNFIDERSTFDFNSDLLRSRECEPGEGGASAGAGCAPSGGLDTGVCSLSPSCSCSALPCSSPNNTNNNKPRAIITNNNVN